MSFCALCSEGDGWLKTVRDGEGDVFPICDPCWEADRSGLVIVPGLFTVTAKCIRCGCFGNPRYFSDLRPSYWKEAYGGTCRGCEEGRG